MFTTEKNFSPSNLERVNEEIEIAEMQRTRTSVGGSLGAERKTFQELSIDGHFARL
jgi:hypothetical protein